MSIIIEESQSLVEYIKKLINDEYNIQINKSKIYYNNNEFNDGQIYKLVKKNKKDETKLINNYIINEKELKASDLYMNANEYTRNNMTQSQPGTIISMHNIFGITVLNSLWKMLAGKRLFVFYYFNILFNLNSFQFKFIKESNNFLIE